MPELHVDTLVALLAFAAGAAFGATAQRTNFCTMGAIADLVNFGDAGRLRAWPFAMAVAIAGSQALHLAGLVDLGRSIYFAPSLGWLGALLGGLMFGFGMVLAGGCVNRTLVRLGAGSLKALVVAIVLGLFAYMTLRGLIGLARVAWIEPAALALPVAGGLPELAARATGIGTATARAIVAVLAAATLAAVCFADATSRASRRDVAAGTVVGLLIPAGWAITGIAGADDFDPAPLASFTFVAPLGESLVYLMTFSGASINFGIAAVGGVIAGAFLAALAAGRLRLEGFSDARDMLRHLVGAALMGTGGVLALGCTIGQGITGLSTLVAGPLIAVPAIVAGAVAGLKYLEEGSLAGSIRALITRG